MAEEIADKGRTALEGGTYEILQSRIEKNADRLNTTLGHLNAERKRVFGSIETKVLATERVTTDNNCVPWDMHALGNRFLFGYNVLVGLRSEVKPEDVLSCYEYREDHTFHELPLEELIHDPVFLDDFQKLYKYYRHTQFLRFAEVGPFLHMVFRIGKEVTDLKTFKWALKGDELVYVDNRSEHEYEFPPQQDFEWTRTRREDFREGLHPHVSIRDRVFVETVGGDLTVKIEDNTEDGAGIYSEEVDNREQTLADGDIQFAELDHLVLMKVRPYQEDYRYLLYNDKLKEVRRIDSMKDACRLLPDGHGIIFSDGYYLQSGVFKQFDYDLEDMLFERRITSLNGEDYLYVFYNRQHGIFLLLNYNLISQQAENPLICHGFTIFENGEMCVFKADGDAKRHHAIQVWQTPYTGPNFQSEERDDSFLQKIGNKSVVRVMAECQEIINLVNKEEVYADLYLDIIKKCTDIIDTYHWLDKEDGYNLLEPLKDIRTVAESTVDEFDKVRKLQENTARRLTELEVAKDAVLKKSKASFGSITLYVDALGEVRAVRGEVLSAKDLRYVDVELLDSFDVQLAEASDQLSESCIRFLAQERALAPFEEQVQQFETKIEEIKKVVDADELQVTGEKIAQELDLLIETVSNLRISDATQTTKIIEDISEIYGQYNKVKVQLANKRKSLLSTEGKAEFAATLKLLDQSVTNYLDISDTPEQCDEYLTRLIVQIEELEGKFSDFDEFVEVVAQKREEIYNAFESRKLYLAERRSKKTNQLFQAGERVLGAIRSKAGRLKTKEEINGYFASDLMVDKVRGIVQQLVEAGDTVKADDISSQLKTIKEDVLRQLKDKEELFVDGDNILSMGNHKFYTNQLNLDLSMVVRNGFPHYHLAGTDFFEEIEDERLRALSDLWDQTLVSESESVYRSEYLAYQLLNQMLGERTLRAEVAAPFHSIERYLDLTDEEKVEAVRKVIATKYDEGYTKGIHDVDAMKILEALVTLVSGAGVMRYASEARTLAKLFWKSEIENEARTKFLSQMKAAGIILSVFPTTQEFAGVVSDLRDVMGSSVVFDGSKSGVVDEAAAYLFDELSAGSEFTASGKAARLYAEFTKALLHKRADTKFRSSWSLLQQDPLIAIRTILRWLDAFIAEAQLSEDFTEVKMEVAALLFYDDFSAAHVSQAVLTMDLQDMNGGHECIEEGRYALQLNHFMARLRTYVLETVPRFRSLQALKKELTEDYRDALKLHEFKPRVLSSFVRNQLIDKVYFPLIGANLAKQIGTAGEGKRTDLMGLLLLISPPGYGKTTLMEYIASRLGVVFMKINGPAIGHEVTSLDPADAPNAASAEELQKLNLSFEMGNNVMIYLDDIQHCNPEFLQKFISMCDAQRRIEGVYKGRTKTYDFRGKKVCVVMAGNPYTESGDKFQIPDMLANRADIYNLGDVIGDSADVFNLSYIENSLTSNNVLSRLASRSLSDVRQVLKLAETGSSEGLKFEVSHSAEELQEYVAVLKHMMAVRDVILLVNSLYIQSAAMSDEYREEPPFKLQGSYRDMNKIAEKLLPMMNDEEVQTIIHSHYENESQTLTSNAEANLLKFKQMTAAMGAEEGRRWELILEQFAKIQKQKGYGQGAQLAEGMEAIANSLKQIGENIHAASNSNTKKEARTKRPPAKSSKKSN
ncbi:MAG: DNA repair ATPase [Bacteroidota bacterium]